MASRTGKITPMNAPLKGETVEDPERGHGTVTRITQGATAVFVKFEDMEGEVMYTHRTALGVWKEFPGRADAPGLVPLE